MDYKIEHKQLEELVYEKIRDMILFQTLKPGDKIVQSELAESLGVSRTPIRNALAQLAQQHLVEIGRAGATHVRNFSKEEMVAIFEIREVLEGLACRRASTVVKDDDLERFRGMFQKAMESGDEVDNRAYQKVDMKFHSFLTEVSGLTLLKDIIKAFHILSRSFIPGLIRPPKETLQEHMAMIDALRNREPDAAEAIMREHLKKSTAVIRGLNEDEH